MTPAEVGPYLARMRTEDLATGAAEAYEVMEDPDYGVDGGTA
jgi:hypothetical protein